MCVLLEQTRLSTNKGVILWLLQSWSFLHAIIKARVQSLMGRNVKRPQGLCYCLSSYYNYILHTLASSGERLDSTTPTKPWKLTRNHGAQGNWLYRTMYWRVVDMVNSNVTFLVKSSRSPELAPTLHNNHWDYIEYNTRGRCYRRVWFLCINKKLGKNKKLHWYIKCGTQTHVDDLFTRILLCVKTRRSPFISCPLPKY